MNKRNYDFAAWWPNAEAKMSEAEICLKVRLLEAEYLYKAENLFVGKELREPKSHTSWNVDDK